MGVQQDLEKQMDELLVKKAPFQIPENGRKAIVKYLPFIALLFGILSLLASLSLWNAANRVDDYVDYLNQLGATTGYDYGLLYYLALFSLVVQALILLIAYKPLKNNQKKGWDLLLLGVVVSFVYGVMYMFTDPGGIGNFVGTLLGTTIGLYVLAQIRSYYKKSATTKK